MLFRKLSVVRQGLNTFPLRLYFIPQELNIVACAPFIIYPFLTHCVFIDVCKCEDQYSESFSADSLQV